MSDSSIDFNAAAEFLRQARQAEEAGNVALSLAARQMVVVALDLGLPTHKVTRTDAEHATRSGD